MVLWNKKTLRNPRALQQVVQYTRGGLREYNWGNEQILDHSLAHPTIQAIAAAHGRSVAQVVLNYQAASNISVNPGFTGPGIAGYKPMATVRAYMGENLHFFDFALTAADMAAIAAIGK